MAYGETRIQTQLSFMGLDGYCYYVGGVYMPFYSAWKLCIFAGLDSFSAAIVGKFLGINALASVGASTSVVFLILQPDGKR